CQQKAFLQEYVVYQTVQVHSVLMKVEPLLLGYISVAVEFQMTMKAEAVVLETTVGAPLLKVHPGRMPVRLLLAHMGCQAHQHFSEIEMLYHLGQSYHGR